MDAAAEIGRNPVSKHQIQPEYEDDQADAGRDCQTRLATPNSGANADREILTFRVQLITGRIGNNDMDSLVIVCYMLLSW